MLLAISIATRRKPSNVGVVQNLKKQIQTDAVRDYYILVILMFKISNTGLGIRYSNVKQFMHHTLSVIHYMTRQYHFAIVGLNIESRFTCVNDFNFEKV